MKELLRTDDLVSISFVESLLTGGGIECVVLDGNTGALTIGVIPSRIMVDDEDLAQAQRLLREAGELPA